MNGRVLLTSEYPQSDSEFLATLLHDARNKLAAIMANLEYCREGFGANHFRTIKRDVEQVEKEIDPLFEGSKAGGCTAEVLNDMQLLRGRLGLILLSTKEYLKADEYADSRKDIIQASEELDRLIERGQLSIQNQPSDESPQQGNLSDFVLSVAHSFQRCYPQISFHFAIDTGCKASFYPSSIKTTLENLLNNAVQSLSEEGGEISVNLKAICYDADEKPFTEIEDGPYIRIEIRDNGAGIPKDVLHSLRHSLVTTKEGGSGIGLASASNSMGEHGGYLFIESEKERGTIVTALLPSSFPPSEAPTIRSPEKK